MVPCVYVQNYCKPKQIVLNLLNTPTALFNPTAINKAHSDLFDSDAGGQFGSDVDGVIIQERESLGAMDSHPRPDLLR